MDIAFVGTGNMGGALLRGILAGGQDPARVTATTRSAERARALADDLGLRARALEDDPGANRAAVRGAEYVFVGVKPWMFAETLAELRDALEPDAVVVSMAAGVDITTLEHLVPGHSVVRIMPNTPVSVSKGVISLVPSQQVPEAVVASLTELLSPLGLVVPITEEQMPLLVGISGSGVAYFFQLAEHMANAAAARGLDRDVAARVLAATVEGAGQLLAQTPDPEALRTAVTSKGGTTYAALTAFAEGGLEDLTTQAVRAAGERSLQMEAENRDAAGL